MRIDMRLRTRQFALRTIRFYMSMPKSVEAQILGKQLLRCGTSVGAQYREAFRGRSDAEFISKMESALQELDESMYWLELLQDSGIISSPEAAEKANWLHDEANQLIAMFTVSVKNCKQRVKQAH